MKGEINSNIMIVGDFNIPISIMVEQSRQKIKNKTLDLNYMLHQNHLIDIYVTFDPTTAEYTFSSNTHEIFFRIDNVRPQNRS